MTEPVAPLHESSVIAVADQLRAAWQAGYSKGRDGSPRCADPHIHEDRDLHIAWDEGWIAGSEANDAR